MGRLWAGEFSGRLLAFGGFGVALGGFWGRSGGALGGSGAPVGSGKALGRLWLAFWEALWEALEAIGDIVMTELGWSNSLNHSKCQRILIMAKNTVGAHAMSHLARQCGGLWNLGGFRVAFWQALGLWEALGRLWEASGEVLGGLWKALGRLWGGLGRLWGGSGWHFRRLSGGFRRLWERLS